MENLKNYIDSLEMPANEGMDVQRTSFASASQTSALINKGCMVGFDAGISAQLYLDILYSTLLACTATEKRHDRTSSPENWNREYIKTLSMVGWSIYGQSFSTYHTDAGNFRMDNVSIGYIKEGASPDAVQSLVSGSSKLAREWGSKAGTIFATSCSSGDSGNFQVIAAEADGSVTLGSFFFNSQESHRDFFTAEWNSRSTKLSCYVYKMQLNLNIYNQVRHLIIDKLADQIDRYIATI